jgi:hypothetical protein
MYGERPSYNLVLKLLSGNCTKEWCIRNVMAWYRSNSIDIITWFAISIYKSNSRLNWYLEESFGTLQYIALRVHSVTALFAVLQGC